MPLEETLTGGAGFAGEQSKTEADRRKSLQKQETPALLFRNLPGETAAVKETHLPQGNGAGTKWPQLGWLWLPQPVKSNSKL